jgi:hypothetical protein
MPFQVNRAEAITKVRKLLRLCKKEVSAAGKTEIINQILEMIIGYAVEIGKNQTPDFIDEIPDTASVSQSVKDGKTVIDGMSEELSSKEALRILFILLAEEGSSTIEGNSIIEEINKRLRPDKSNAQVYNKVYNIAKYLLTQLEDNIQEHQILQGKDDLDISYFHEDANAPRASTPIPKIDYHEKPKDDLDISYFHEDANAPRASTPIPKIDYHEKPWYLSLLDRLTPEEHSENYSILGKYLDKEHNECLDRKQHNNDRDALALFEALDKHYLNPANQGGDIISPDRYIDIKNYLLRYLIETKELELREIKAILKIIQTTDIREFRNSDILEAIAKAYKSLDHLLDDFDDSKIAPDDSQLLEDSRFSESSKSLLDSDHNIHRSSWADDDPNLSRLSESSHSSYRTNHIPDMTPGNGVEDLLPFLEECRKRSIEAGDNSHQEEISNDGDDKPDEDSDKSSVAEKSNGDQTTDEEIPANKENTQQRLSSYNNTFQPKKIVTIDFFFEEKRLQDTIQNSKEYKEWKEAMDSINDSEEKQTAFVKNITVNIEIEEAPNDYNPSSFSGLILEFYSYGAAEINNNNGIGVAY